MVDKGSRFEEPGSKATGAVFVSFAYIQVIIYCHRLDPQSHLRENFANESLLLITHVR